MKLMPSRLVTLRLPFAFIVGGAAARCRDTGVIELSEKLVAWAVCLHSGRSPQRIRDYF